MGNHKSKYVCLLLFFCLSSSATDLRCPSTNYVAIVRTPSTSSGKVSKQKDLKRLNLTLFGFFGRHPWELDSDVKPGSQSAQMKALDQLASIVTDPKVIDGHRAQARLLLGIAANNKMFDERTRKDVETPVNRKARALLDKIIAAERG